MQRKDLRVLSFWLCRRRESPGPCLQEGLDLPGGQGWNPHRSTGRPRSPGRVTTPIPSAVTIQQTVCSTGKKTGSGKKNELESHLLMTVPGEWKTEFPSWSNYSLVFLMKPNQASFQCLVDVSEASFPHVLGSERKYLLTSWSFLIIIYDHLVPRKIFVIFLMTFYRGTWWWSLQKWFYENPFQLRVSITTNL